MGKAATRRRSLLEVGLDAVDCVPATVADLWNTNAMTDMKSLNDASKVVENAAALVKLVASYMKAGEETHGTCDAAKTLREIMGAGLTCTIATCNAEKCVKTSMFSCDVKPSWVLDKLAAGQGDFTTKFAEAATACAAFTTADTCTKDTGKVADDAAIQKAANYEPPANAAQGMSQSVSFVAAVAGALAYFLML